MAIGADIQIRPFRADDYDRLARGRREDDAADRAAFVVPELSYTLELGGEPVIAGGFLPQWGPPEGRALGWCCHNGVYWRLWPLITRECRVLIDKAIAMGFVRLEAQIRVDHKAGISWAKTLGFQPEAYLPRFMGGRGYWQYSIVVGEHGR